MFCIHIMCFLVWGYSPLRFVQHTSDDQPRKNRLLLFVVLSNIKPRLALLLLRKSPCLVLTVAIRLVYSSPLRCLYISHTLFFAYSVILRRVQFLVSQVCGAIRHFLQYITAHWKSTLQVVCFFKCPQSLLKRVKSPLQGLSHLTLVLVMIFTLLFYAQFVVTAQKICEQGDKIYRHCLLTIVSSTRSFV